VRAIVVIACLVLLAACSSKSGTIATSGTRAERALCAALAKSTFQADTAVLLAAVVNDSGASAVMVRDSAVLSADLIHPTVAQDPKYVQDQAKLEIDCQS
jgi:hypothetical protein